MRLISVLLAFLVAASAEAGALTVREVASLAQSGLSEKAIGRLIEVQGMTAPLSAHDVLELRGAGLSADFVSALVLRQNGSGIEVEQRDGVTVVSGAGVQTSQEPGASPSEEEPAVLHETVVVAGGEEAATPVNGYPAGAAFGFAGGAVFLPARFGGSQPSPFGRTIVSFGGSGPACAPVVQACAPVVVAPEPRHVVIHTSRGEIWLPN